jgi:cell division protein FtsB
MASPTATLDRSAPGGGDPAAHASRPEDVPGGQHASSWPPRTPVRRRHLAVLGSGIAVVLVLMVFANALTEAGRTNDRAAALRAQNAQLVERLRAARAEVELVKGDAFVRLQARAYGMGEADERVFALEDGAPAPPPITPLGDDPGEKAPMKPLEAWLELLFGP